MDFLVVDILKSFLGEPRKQNEDTEQVAFDCPSCSDDKGMPDGDGKGNLEINYGKGVFKCWSCGETHNMHGPVIKLLKKYATPKNIRDYLLVKPDTNLTNNKDKPKVILTLPEGYKKLSECTEKDFKYSQAILYLHERGVTDEIIKEYEIGYSFKGKFFNRIIIPSYNSDGELNYFIARWFPKEFTKLKYLNPDAEKQEIIFNEGKINWDSTIYLVEGVFEHIVIPNSIPLLGKFISESLLDKLHDNAKAFVVIVLDGDAYKDAINLYKKINFGDLRDRVKIVKISTDKDPSEIFQESENKGIVELLKKARKPTNDELYFSDL
jgi:DNA primase